MSKKDYILIADCINSFALSSVVNNNPVSMGHVSNLIDIFESQLSANNPKFDDYKFEGVCIKDMRWGQINQLNDFR